MNKSNITRWPLLRLLNPHTAWEACVCSWLRKDDNNELQVVLIEGLIN